MGNKKFTAEQFQGESHNNLIRVYAVASPNDGVSQTLTTKRVWLSLDGYKILMNLIIIDGYIHITEINIIISITVIIKIIICIIINYNLNR